MKQILILFSIIFITACSSLKKKDGDQTKQSEAMPEQKTEYVCVQEDIQAYELHLKTVLRVERDYLLTLRNATGITEAAVANYKKFENKEYDFDTFLMKNETLEMTLSELVSHATVLKKYIQNGRLILNDVYVRCQPTYCQEDVKDYQEVYTDISRATKEQEKLFSLKNEQLQGLYMTYLSKELSKSNLKQLEDSINLDLDKNKVQAKTDELSEKAHLTYNNKFDNLCQ